MSRRDVAVGFGAGLVVGLAVAFTSVSERTMPRASAQAPPAAAPRYQISAWAHAGTSSGTGSVVSQPAHGVYVLDTHTGKLWQAMDGQPLKPAGEAK